MRKVFSVLSLSLLFLLFSHSVYAYDLEVHCGDSKCNISSNDPLFDPSTSWMPEQSVEKEVVVKNVGSHGKEIFFQATRKVASGSLDPYMNFKLYRDGIPVWSGSLESLLATQNVSLGHLAAGEAQAIRLVAQMDSDTPNSLQGSSSEFDFSFGFPGELSSGSDEGGGDNSRNTEGGAGVVQAEENEASGGLVQVLGQILSGIFNENEQVSTPDSGEAQIEGVQTQRVLGVSDEGAVCKNNYVWVGVILAQLIIGLLFVIHRFHSKILSPMSQVFLFVAAALAIYFFGCAHWPILISAGIFVALFLHSKRKVFINVVRRFAHLS